MCNNLTLFESINDYGYFLCRIYYVFAENFQGKIFDDRINELLTNETFIDDISTETSSNTAVTTFNNNHHSIINTISMTTMNSNQASYHKQFFTFFFIQTMIHLFL
jgi:hypothetical protein